MSSRRYVSSLKQTLTYWEAPTNDGFGGLTPNAVGVLLSCRWQNDNVLFRTPQSNEETSSAVVYVENAPQIGGFFALGDFTTEDPLTLEGAFEIRQVKTSPDLKNTYNVVKVFL
jgi:hypothetical protein